MKRQSIIFGVIGGITGGLFSYFGYMKVFSRYMWSHYLLFVAVLLPLFLAVRIAAYYRRAR